MKMLEVTNADTGESVYYTGAKAKQMLEIWRGHHGLKVRHIDGRARPKFRRVCMDCQKVIEEKPSTTGEDVTSDGLCGTCLLKRIERENRTERDSEAVQEHWIEME